MNYCSKCGCPISENDKFCTNCGAKLSEGQASQSPKTEKNFSSKDLFFIILFGIICMPVLINGIYTEDTKTPRLPKDLKCVQYKNLCIATTDVKYDYTAVQTPDPRYYNSKWNNGWASAQNACKAWGGRLPYMEEFPTILEAYFAGKIKLEENGDYLSLTEINWHRVYAFSNSWAISRDKKYDKNNIYDSAISIAKSADSNITGNYHTSEIYSWRARCIKPINKRI